jgi:hypothetical protein
MKNPEQPKENPTDHPGESEVKQTETQPPRPEDAPEREVVQARVAVIENTRRDLENLARRLPRIEGARQDRFVA